MNTLFARLLLTQLIAAAFTWNPLFAEDAARTTSSLPQPTFVELRGGTDLGKKSVQSAEVAVGYQFSSQIEFQRFPDARLRLGVESALGGLARSGRGTLLFSVGPSLSVTNERSTWFVGFALAPTFLSHPKLADFDIGGNFHFKTSATLGRKIGERTFALYRFQHISNGGIKMQNPGVDLHCLGLRRVF